MPVTTIIGWVKQQCFLFKNTGSNEVQKKKFWQKKLKQNLKVKKKIGAE